MNNKLNLEKFYARVAKEQKIRTAKYHKERYSDNHKAEYTLKDIINVINDYKSNKLNAFDVRCILTGWGIGFKD